jgi:hypothetical protein
LVHLIVSSKACKSIIALCIGWLKMRDRSSQQVTFALSHPVLDRLEQVIVATHLDASTVINLSLEMFFEDQPGADMLEKFRLLKDARKAELTKYRAE